MSRLSKIAFTITVVAASLLVATPAMGAEPPGPKLVPFQATFTGTYQARVAPPNVIIIGTGGRGVATHLGRFELTDRVVVSLMRRPVPNCPIPGTVEVFNATLYAANGDSITLAGPGTGCQIGPTTVKVVDAVTVTGGTGRFEGASGSITVTTFVNQAKGTEVITFNGTISAPGSTK